MNMRDYPTLHLDTNWSKGTTLSLLFYISQSQTCYLYVKRIIGHGSPN
jgi:hypothetical protein